MNKQYLDIKPEIQEALAQGKPVVALESTILSHGMPYPKNMEMALRTEEIIRENGAIPATIALMDGIIKIGLNQEELEIFATAKDVLKVSRRDMAYCLAQKKLGAVTVAGTMICADLAGIRFFVTGGIGGVHRGYDDAMDVSADLDELAQTDVCVICAGAKAILDLPRTMEYLETKGVPVIGYGTETLPAFYSVSSGIPVPITLNSPEEVAELLRAKHGLALGGGTLVANPIPEADALPADQMEEIIAKAIDQMNEEGVSGKEITPYLLSHIVEATEGKSLEANIALVYNNARVGAQIATAYAKK